MEREQSMLRGGKDFIKPLPTVNLEDRPCNVCVAYSNDWKAEYRMFIAIGCTWQNIIKK